MRGSSPPESKQVATHMTLERAIKLVTWAAKCDLYSQLTGRRPDRHLRNNAAEVQAAITRVETYLQEIT